MSTVALLNASYEPLGGVSFPHAVRMLFRQVAVVEEAEDGRSIGPYPWPRSVRLVRYVAAYWLYRPASCTKRNVLRRDGGRCCYCGGHGSTLDHVQPMSRGGGSDWLNLVTACERCNSRKANRTPPEAGMRLRRMPWVPTLAQLHALA
ncbi:MAG: HNH endonuclease [Nocardioides sp.]